MLTRRRARGRAAPPREEPREEPRPGAGGESRGEPRGPSLWWPSAASAAIAGAAVLADHQTRVGWRQILAWACAAVAVLAIAWSLALARRLRATRARSERHRRTAEARAAEVDRLVSVRLPAIAGRLRAGKRLEGVPGPLAPAADTGAEFAGALAAVVTALGSDDAVRRERALRDSVQAAFESVARNMHAMATVQQQVLDRVEQTIENPRLMAEVMKADHAAAQMTRKAQTLLVMCGIWPARRETRPVSLYDCVRGAQSRIVEFNRVEVHGGQTLYVVPPAVEGLMHAIAELLENATVFSPSRTKVMVTVREVGAGAVVEIDDAGLGMPPDVLRQSTARLRDELDLAELGAVPRLGLSCVGRWTRELGFSVELTGASAYGGTRAVTFVPYRLLTEPLSHFAAGHGEIPRRRPRERAEPPAQQERPEPRGRHSRTAPARRTPAPAPAPAPAPYENGAGDTGDGYGGSARHRAGHSPRIPAGRPEPSGTPGGSGTAPYGTPPGPAGAGGYRDTGPAVPPDAPQHSAAHREPARPFDAYGAAQHPSAPQDDRARESGAPGALPRRRSRRGAAVEAAAQQALQQAPPAAPVLPAGRPEWTPEAARASITSVVTGSRRGRAAVAGAGSGPAPGTGADPGPGGVTRAGTGSAAPAGGSRPVHPQAHPHPHHTAPENPPRPTHPTDSDLHHGGRP